ncbi:MAG: hypothetical protein IJN82_06630 [Clostridia bacterium]|nr:hypothetical protein [Clostridia bacterium]
MSEQNFFKGHIEDLIFREARGELMVFSSFLTPEESEIAAAICRKAKAPFLLYGGYDDSERKILAVSSMDAEVLVQCFPIAVIQFLGDLDGISNRDVLGSLMASGIRRDVLGDIIVQDGLALVLVADHIKDYILNNITSIGRKNVEVKVLSDDFEIPKREYEQLRLTVASMRLDAVVGAVTHLSREQACRLIEGKQTAINHCVIDKKTKEVQAGDRLIVRGHGKWIVDSCDMQTKKGRTVIICRKYI